MKFHKGCIRVSVAWCVLSWHVWQSRGRLEQQLQRRLSTRSIGVGRQPTLTCRCFGQDTSARPTRPQRFRTRVRRVATAAPRACRPRRARTNAESTLIVPLQAPRRSPARPIPRAWRGRASLRTARALPTTLAFPDRCASTRSCASTPPPPSVRLARRARTPSSDSGKWC